MDQSLIAMDEIMELLGDLDSHEAVGGSDQVPIALGGPVFVPDLICPLTRVADFENAVFGEVEDLKAEMMNAELAFDGDGVEDVSVDELKVFTEEELVAEAMKEAFKDVDSNNDAGPSNYQDPTPILPDNFPNARGGNADNMVVPALKVYTRRRKGAVKCEASNGSLSTAIDVSSPAITEDNRNSRKKKMRGQIDVLGNDGEIGESGSLSRPVDSASAIEGQKKGKRGQMNIQEHDDEGYLKKARELAHIRQKQEDDKRTAKLCSLRAHRRKNKHGDEVGEDVERGKSHDWLNYTNKVKLSNIGDYKEVNYPEVILCVEVYHNKKHFQKTQEILVLGEQNLTELKDKIHCLTDVLMEKAEVFDPSGYFMIEETFYNDMRDPSAIDYSEPILDWMHNSEEPSEKWQSIMSGTTKKDKHMLTDEPIPSLPKFKACKMEDTCFRELEFQIGTGYLYCHQGDCKHTIIFRDMRLIHPDDVQNQAAYPIVAYTLKGRLMKCSVCQVYKATRFTVDDKMTPERLCYFCDHCYQLLHYSANNTLLYDDFSVYDYIQ